MKLLTLDGIAVNTRKKKEPVITSSMKSQLTDIVLKILGESIKGRLARAAGVAAVAAATQGTPPVETPPKPPEASAATLPK